MNNILVIQIITSFVVGGLFIAALTLIAENVSDKIAGIILMFPSTIVLGFFFLGWVLSAEEVAAIVPATLIPLGMVVLSSATYIHIAIWIEKFAITKFSQIVLTITISSIVWFILVTPFALIHFTNLTIGVLGYMLITVIAHMLLQKDHGKELLDKPAYTNLQKVYRAIFMGTVIAIIVALGKTMGAFWGGVFSMFPAATFSALVFYHFHYSPRRLFWFMKKAPMGSISLFIYTMGVMILFPRVGIIYGTVAAYLISLISSLILMKLATNRSYKV